VQRAFVASGAILAIGAAVLVAGCGGTRTVTKTVTVAATGKTGPGAPGTLVQFGYIKSLRRTGGGYELRFDPAWMLSGITANQAKLEDTGSSDVPNDYYIVNEGKRLLTYKVPANARVTVLSKSPTSTPISVDQLAAIVGGTSKRHLYEPITTGFWILVNIDTVRSLDQQYLP
jgi:hypothetical protein